ncbi:TetR/AcrR family transcriptional regulator [Streptacidiphilus sp. PB12-B1b]|uniref:TetR/AcrR family transcriptional regulator n=1 Tax=Streptacidiphilus sp. PB12-B1b TaxID=2705012 RepID=UPI0015F98CB5|nr:TetR/AcrR family transcriptional regulator [Streptacidiphilus sp. PB12-B1b]QMU78711.1 TetR/AcrR family transcriptional regulator [Streptacidiphilus sp. PB12-B1b]
MTDLIAKTGAPRLRADATRNRERIVAAAQEVFVEFGPDAPLDEIARRAGVGNATLYRHFPDRRELSRSVVLSVFDTMATQAEVMIAEADQAFDALEQVVHGAVEWKVGALCPMFAEWMDPAEPELLAAQNRLDSAVEAIIEKAQAEGGLRTDVGAGDILTVAAQMARPLPGSDSTDHDLFVHRSLQLFLDGLRAPGRSALPGRPVTLMDLRRDCTALSER